MLKSIVVPLDGSRVAERAIPVAARLAKAHEALVHLVLAQQPTQGLAPFGEFGPPSVLVFEELDRQHSGYLERTANRLRKTGIRVKTLLADGAAGRVIVGAAKSARAGLVVMSTHGRGAIERLGLGSVCDYVIRHLETPVLVIPPARIPHGITGRRILVPLDLSPESWTVLEAIEDLLGVTARLTLLHVIEPVTLAALPIMPFPGGLDGALVQLQWDRARRQVETLEEKARRMGFRAATRLLTGVRASAAILDQLHEGGYDLLAMTTHGYGGFRRLLVGSVTNRVIRNARKPILVVRPKARPRQRSRVRRRAEAKK